MISIGVLPCRWSLAVVCSSTNRQRHTGLCRSVPASISGQWVQPSTAEARQWPWVTLITKQPCLFCKAERLEIAWIHRNDSDQISNISVCFTAETLSVTCVCETHVLRDKELRSGLLLIWLIYSPSQKCKVKSFSISPTFHVGTRLKGMHGLWEMLVGVQRQHLLLHFKGRFDCRQC